MYSTSSKVFILRDWPKGHWRRVRDDDFCTSVTVETQGHEDKGTWATSSVNRVILKLQLDLNGLQEIGPGAHQFRTPARVAPATRLTA